MEFLVLLLLVLAALFGILLFMYSRQQRGWPDDLQATRRAAAHDPRGFSNTPAAGPPDFGVGISGT